MINTIQIQVFQINEKEKCRVRLGSMHQLLLIVVVELKNESDQCELAADIKKLLEFNITE